MSADTRAATRPLALAHAPSRYATAWTNTTLTWPDLVGRLATTHRTGETAAQYAAMKRSEQDQIKDVGGFVGGHLREGRRKKGHAHSRSLLTLDIDFPQTHIWDEITMLYPWAALIYSTHKHTPDAPRLRLIIPLARDVTEDEYPALGRKVAEDLGIDAFDDTTYEPTRLMYWPSTPSDGEYVFEVQDGPFLDPDDILGQYDNWRDATTWPVSSRQTRAIVSTAAKQADPLTKPGIVGAFCRTYPIRDAIEQFLGGVYAPSVHEGRYDYEPGESSAGVVIYDEKYSYSHHGTDPASGQLVNAFDLVRLHKYGELDEDAAEGTPANRMPSYRAMVDWARDLDPIKETLSRERLAEAKTEFEAEDLDWLKELELARSGDFADTLTNHVIVAKNDPNLAGIAFNLHRDGIDVRDQELPWEQVKPGWTESDFSQLKAYLQATYRLYAPAKTKDAVLVAAADRAYHPVRDWFEALPPWDGKARVDTLLVDYLGAEDTPYVRAVTRKTLLAAHARIYQPGVKFDSVLILNGPQGAGKSTFFARLARDWFSDALTLTDMKDKTGPEKLQGYWFLELGELAGMRKTDVETVKSFISRTDDKYRAAYGISVESHPRQCVIVGSTNAEAGFLRDITGNRRFWPVTVTGGSTKKPWDMDDSLVYQIWAEIKELAKDREPLYLTGDAAAQAAAAQSAAMETDEREGLVLEYLDTPLPDGWFEMGLHERRTYLAGGGEFGEPGRLGDLERMEVTNIEIWAECFGKDPSLMRPQDSYAISAIMARLPGWERPTKGPINKRYPLYNKQRFWVREGHEDA